MALDRQYAHSRMVKKIVFIGATQEADIESGAQPYILDLATRKSRRLDPQARMSIAISIFSWDFRWVPTPDGYVAFFCWGGNKTVLSWIRVERNGRPGHSRVAFILKWQAAVLCWMPAPDGSIYVDSAEM